MKKAIFLAMLFLLLFKSACFAVRCGSNLANVGDLKHEVLVACGEPIAKEVIGYIDKERNGDRIRVLKIEEWIITSGTFYYSLTFEGNRLATIEEAGRIR